jgi:hypothetical protein
MSHTAPHSAASLFPLLPHAFSAQSSASSFIKFLLILLILYSLQIFIINYVPHCSSLCCKSISPSSICIFCTIQCIIIIYFLCYFFIIWPFNGNILYSILRTSFLLLLLFSFMFDRSSFALAVSIRSIHCHPLLKTQYHEIFDPQFFTNQSPLGH